MLYVFPDSSLQVLNESVPKQVAFAGPEKARKVAVTTRSVFTGSLISFVSAILTSFSIAIYTLIEVVDEVGELRIGRCE